jgi:catechol 2,3-dioxygenase-like lactoylglutathione lyase family enzyme
MSTDVRPFSPYAAPISGLVPMIQVEDIDRSAAFYRLLGFEIGNYEPREGPKHWAWLYAPAAPEWRRGPNLMIARTGRPLNPGAQDVLFYLYAADLPALRTVLVNDGIAAGAICYPEYMPQGEFGAKDPDGYTVMIAQAGPETP